MSIDESDIAFARDLFSDMPSLTHRKMFGGICLYSAGAIFALQSSDGRLYLKTKSPQALFGQDADRFHNMPYFALPEDVLDDPAAACALAARALADLS